MLNPSQLCIDVFTVLRKKNADIETELVDMIGYSDLDLIGTLVANKDKIVQSVYAKVQSYLKSPLTPPPRLLYSLMDQSKGLILLAWTESKNQDPLVHRLLLLQKKKKISKSKLERLLKSLKRQ